MNTQPPLSSDCRKAKQAPSPDWMRLTQQYVNSLQYGQVTLTVHQGEVIEVQKTERTRLGTKRRS